MYKSLLILFLLLGVLAPASRTFAAALPDEASVLDEVVAIGWAGGLGFEFPEGWAYYFDDQYGACGRMKNLGCIMIGSQTPIEESEGIEPVWALTRRSTNHTTFFRDSAAAREAITIAYGDPAKGENHISVIAPQPFTAREMAAYVIGHEVHGHLVRNLDAGMNGEMTSNFYGLQAVRALRAFSKR